MEVTDTKPQGIWGTVLLPVGKDGEIEFSALVEEVDLLCESGLDGIYSNGTAGEFHNQTDAEYEQVTAVVADRARRAGLPFQIGISSSNPRVMRARLERLQDICPNGAQFILPDWWPPSEPELHQFAEGMQESAGETPLILYNPPHAKQRLTLAEIAAMRRVMPNLVGAKLPGGGDDWYEQRRDLLPGFSVFVPGHTVAFGRSRGADGAYSNVACLSPTGAMLHWRMAKDDPPRAAELEARIVGFMQEWIVPLVKSHGLSNGALDKMMAAVGGWGPVSERLLWPHVSAPTVAIAMAREAYSRMLPEFSER